MRTRAPKLAAALAALTLVVAGCSSEEPNIDALPLIEQVMVASRATHVQRASVNTGGQMQFTIWNGTRAEMWNVDVDQGAHLDPNTPQEYAQAHVPAGMAPVDGFDWAGLYEKAKAVRSDKCWMGGVQWEALPTGQVQENLFCNYTTYIEGSTTIDGVPFPDKLDTRTAEGLDEAFRLLEPLMPDGVHLINWDTPAADAASLEVLSATPYTDAKGDTCVFQVTLRDRGAPPIPNMPVVEPQYWFCSSDLYELAIEPKLAERVPFAPWSFGGKGVMDAYQQAMTQTRYPVEFYKTAEVWAQPDGTVVFDTFVAPGGDMDQIIVPVK